MNQRTIAEGTLKTWNDARGFGFIEPLHGGQEIFVHIKAFNEQTGRPEVGQRVTFEVETMPDGKKRAKRVARVRATGKARGRRGENPAQWGTASLFAIPAFLVLFATVALLWGIPGWVAGLYAGASLLSFFVYALDKSAAEADRWRIREDTLLSLGLIGGWPGALVAQQVLRHKSSKAAFRVRFWATVIANVAGFVVLGSPLRDVLLT